MEATLIQINGSAELRCFREAFLLVTFFVTLRLKVKQGKFGWLQSET